MKKLILASVLVLLGCASTGGFVANENTCTTLAGNAKTVTVKKLNGYSRTEFKSKQSELTPNADELAFRFKLIDGVYDDSSIDGAEDVQRVYDEAYNKCMDIAAKQSANNFVNGMVEGFTAEISKPQIHCNTSYGNGSAYTNCW